MLRAPGLAVLLLAGMLCGCAVGPSDSGADAATPGGTPAEADAAPRLAADYAQWARRGERVIALDPGASEVRIHVFRGGRAARLGHDHVLSAPEFSGYVHFPANAPAQGGFDLQFRLDRLRLDDPALRARLGGAYAAQLDEADIASTREHMLGEENLQAARYPYVRLHGLRLVGDAPRFAALMQVELHGVRREAWLPVSVDESGAGWQVAGAFVLRQSDFGVKPYSILGGALAVQDELVVEFRLAGRDLPRAAQ